MDTNSDMGPRLFRVNERVCGISGAVFPPGYHFCPNDDELHVYLRKKNMKQDLDLVDCVIKVIDVYEHKHLPGELLKTHLPTGEQELYFFCPVTMKFPSGLRVKRSTEAGNWRITGQDKKLHGMMMRTLVFYNNEHERTNWIMHEYRLEEKELFEKKQYTDCGYSSEVNYVLYKLYEKNERNLKDFQQAAAYFRQRETEDYAYCDRIVIVPDSLIPELSGSEYLPMDTYFVGEYLKSSTDNDKVTPDVLENTDKVHNVFFKPYEMTEPKINDRQQDGASFEEIDMIDIRGSKLSGSEYLPVDASAEDISLQSSTEDKNTPNLLGIISKSDSYRVQSLPNKSQTAQDMELKDVESRDIYDASFQQVKTADVRMHTEAWDATADINAFDSRGCGLPDMCMDEFSWFNLSDVRDPAEAWDSGINSNAFSNFGYGRMLSDMCIDEFDWFGLYNNREFSEAWGTDADINAFGDRDGSLIQRPLDIHHPPPNIRT